ncbi:MAG TPA: response regulator transcription factor [Candidatus Limnocylindrales bacterium]|jgi:DNA-binding response OmpR family regulator
MATAIDAAPALRAGWLVLASGGPALQLPSVVANTGVLVLDDPAEFHGALVGLRPRIAVLAMPPADPADVALLAHERRRRPLLRTALITPASAAPERLAALDLGIDDAVSDAIDPHELAGRLTILADRARSRPGRTLPIAMDAELDLAAHELRRRGLIVHLRPKEYRLLALLAAHPGRAYTRRQLLDRVWGPAHKGGARTVDVHVRWLRSKIEADPDRPVHLVTVRGVGYRLDPLEAIAAPGGFINTYPSY